ncbi:MAG: hypothetical protein ACOCW2_01490 [Chitinivibrionales bacterium]
MPTMAVLPMTSDDADIEHTSWTKRIEAECVKYKLYTMVDRVDIENVFKEQAMQQTGAFSEESMSKFGSLLGADYVLVSTLHTQKENTLDLKIISVSTGEISHFVQWSASSSARELYRHGIESAVEVLLTDTDIKKGTADHRKERIGRISKKIISATMLAAGIGSGIWAVSNTSSAMNASNRYNETGNAEYKTAYDDARDKATYGYIACGVSLPLSVLFFLWK